MSRKLLQKAILEILLRLPIAHIEIVEGAAGDYIAQDSVGPGWLGLPAEPGRETQRCGGATGGSADLRGKHPEPWPIIDSSFRCLFKVGYKVNEWPTRANWGQLIRVANEYEPLHVAEVDSRDDRIEIIEGKH